MLSNFKTGILNFLFVRIVTFYILFVDQILRNLARPDKPLAHLDLGTQSDQWRSWDVSGRLDNLFRFI